MIRELLFQISRAWELNSKAQESIEKQVQEEENLQQEYNQRIDRLNGLLQNCMLDRMDRRSRLTTVSSGTKQLIGVQNARSVGR